MRNVTCRCEKSFDAELPEEIDLDAEPGRLEEILSGEFLAAVCPHCGERLKPELSIRVRSRKRGLDVAVLPEIERLAFYLGKATVPRGAEVLVGYPELFERARSLRDGLDAEALEIVKYWLLTKAEDQAPEGSTLLVSYSGIAEDGRLRFQIEGLKEGEIAILPVGRDYYERTLKDKARTLRTEPFDAIFKGQYRSLRALEMAED